ncbi:MAG: hypothetical protein NXH86_08085 [Flavobacteriaceae bacterium]|uniref:hypothetical protein n=1 Tax=Flagellimonas TaxID=444459 RepID=UPI003BA99191|nr:hypothetical protein [Flavobacteriaceae bacterium]
MKNKLLILILLVLLVGCNNEKLTRQETVTRYYYAFDSANYNEIKTLTNDSITITSGDYVTSYTHESFYEFFKWDSIFKSSYEIVELEEQNNDIIVTVAQENIRNEYLENNPLVYKVKVSFDSGKVSKMEDLDYIDVNWEVWSQKRDSLVNWIRDNHPDLDGFVNDMTMNGAMNYLKAVEKYTTYKGAFERVELDH